VQYAWNSWSDGGAIAHIVTAKASTNFTANFMTRYYLTLIAGNGGRVSPDSLWTNSGAAVRIRATASNGFAFGGWAGSGSGSYSGGNNPASGLNERPDHSKRRLYATRATNHRRIGQRPNRRPADLCHDARIFLSHRDDDQSRPGRLVAGSWQCHQCRRNSPRPLPTPTGSPARIGITARFHRNHCAAPCVGLAFGHEAWTNSSHGGDLDVRPRRFRFSRRDERQAGDGLLHALVCRQASQHQLGLALDDGPF
jgi:hypothetical protein